jgi:hypothetical protein
MLQLHRDPLALRLDDYARQRAFRTGMRARRTGPVRRRFGGWLVSVGQRLDPDTASMRPAADRQ